MVEWTARVVMIRTTRDGDGRWCGIVTGMGATPELALAELRREGEALGQQVGQEAAQAAQVAKKAAKKAADDRRAEIRHREAARDGVHRPPAGFQQQAEESVGDKPQDDGPRYWRFEVVDVRLTPAPEEGGRSGWLAYGTLAWEGEDGRAYSW